MASELNLPSLADGPHVIFPYVKLVSKPLLPPDNYNTVS